MMEICWGGALFLFVIGGIGLSLCASLAWDESERLCLAAALGCVIVYFYAWVVYWLQVPAVAFAALPAMAALGLAWNRKDVSQLFRSRLTRETAASWALVAGWSLGLLALIRNYSGGEWSGDWVEHYDRARFFLEHRPLSTRFLDVYQLPARPPLANLVVGALMSLSGSSFAFSQVFLTLLSTLAFFPAALLMKRFNGGSLGRTSLLAVLLMLNPLFVENATLAWTKLPAAFFVLTGLYFYLGAGAENASARVIISAIALAAGVLTHYSAAPYALILASAWGLQQYPRRNEREVRSATLWAGLGAVTLLATWFIWSARHYGAATFLSNTSVTDNIGLTFQEQIARRAVNFFNLVVPHPLRPAQYEFLAQTSRTGWWRDYFFNLYQTNLFFIFGLGGALALLPMIGRRRASPSAFWKWFVVAAVAANAAVISWTDRWGAAHIGLQPLALLGLAWLAAEWKHLPRALRMVCACGLALDFCLGIVLHISLEHFSFTGDPLLQTEADPLIMRYGLTLWRNVAQKYHEGFRFVGDDDWNVPLICVFLLAWLALALTRARSASIAGQQDRPAL